MKRYIKVILFFIAGILSFSGSLSAQDTGPVYYFEMSGEIGPSTWRLTQKAFGGASAQKAQAMIIRMNTYGGLVDYADSIRTLVLNAPIKTIVYIDKNAASAGALIAIACDKIYMSRGASIGAASVVDPKGSLLPEKYQSYMRGLMRTTAEAKGRNPKIAEAFVDPNIDIKDTVSKGKVLTLTTSEAINAGYCVAQVSGVKDILESENLAKAKVYQHQVSILDRMIDFLIMPVISGILILLIIGGIYFEMQAPGSGIALVVAIVAALLFFAPLYLEGLAQHWEIGLFILGVVLVLLEIFVIPGFGITGLMGLLCIIVGLALSMVMNNFFDLTVTGSEQISGAFILVITSMVMAIVLSVILGRSFFKSRAFKRLVLQDEQQSDQGYVAGRTANELAGKEGVARTDMRPSGKIEVEGKWYDAIALDGYLAKGTPVYVEKNENYNVFVREKK